MSREIERDVKKNPPGFSDRLRLLVDGWGYSTRDLAQRAGVSHGSIANWLADSARAGADDAERVAQVFGWTGAELLHGEPRRDVMLRMAELEAFRATALRLAASIVHAGERAEVARPGRVPARDPDATEANEGERRA